MLVKFLQVAAIREAINETFKKLKNLVFLHYTKSVRFGSIVWLSKSSEIFLELQNTVMNEIESVYTLCAFV